MAQTQKPLSDRDGQQTLQASYNDVNDTLGVDGFVVGKVGRKVVRSQPTSVQEQFDFSEDGTLLYSILVIYTDSTLGTLVSVERIA